jgi:hypothetical protein
MLSQNSIFSMLSKFGKEVKMPVVVMRKGKGVL